MKIYMVFIIMSLLFLPFFANGMTRVYEEKTEDQITGHYFKIEKSGSGYLIHLTSKTGDNSVIQAFEVDDSLATLSWNFENPEQNTKITASRAGNQILLEGSSKGKQINKTFKINELPWNQTFNIGLEDFVVSKEKVMIFWSIGTRGPGNMKITKFKAKKRDIETITLQDKEVKAVHITISLTGLLSVFWTGKYWYRESDGVFLRYKGKNGPGTDISIMELASMTD